MLKIKVNKNNILEVKEEKTQVFINNEVYEWDISKISDNLFHVIQDSQSYNIELISADYETKTFKIRINGKVTEVEAKDKFDLLLEKLGMNEAASTKVNEIKAPMPGMIINILAEEGKEVNVGDQLIILEAMKMENIIKSPRAGLIKNIKVKKGDSVEKNQILIQF